MTHSTTPRWLFSAVAIPLALVLTRAQAAPVPDPAPGDIFLGIRATGGDGGSVSYLFNLGNDLPFRNAAPGSTITMGGTGSVGADLTATFGSDWHSRDDVLWGIFGVRNSISPVVYGSKPRPNAGTVSTAWPALSDTSRGTVAGAIVSVQEEVGGFKGSEATPNNPRAIFQTNASTASSYAQQVGAAGTSDFGSLSLWTSIEGVSATGIASTVLDLYRISGVGVTRTGSFTIDAAGTVTFTAPAPPGPVDSDGDGFTDEQEIHTGTNPNDPRDFFRIATVTATETGIRLQSPTAANRTYSIQYTPDLSTAWQEIGTHASGAGAAPLDFTDNNAERLALPRGFYRTRIL